MVVGVLGAIAQEDVKRIFSFYIVSQIGYIIMGLGLFTVAGLAGAVYAIVHHIVVKTTLFLVGGLIEHAGGSSRLHRLGGMVATAPVVAVLFLLPALSLAGIPPFSGLRRQVRAVRRHRPLAASGTILAVAVARQPADAVLGLQGLDRRVLEPARQRRRRAGRVERRPRDDARRRRRAARRRTAADARADGACSPALTLAIGVAAGPLYELQPTGPPPTSSTRRLPSRRCSAP